MWSIVDEIVHVLSHESEQMPLAEYDHVVEQFATQRADPSFGVSVLPRRIRRNLYLLDAQVFEARVEGGTVDAIAVSNQIRRYEIRANGLDNLLRRPLRVRVRCHVNVQYSAALDRNHEEYVENVERDRWHRQKVDRERSRQMIAEERLPGLRRRTERKPWKWVQRSKAGESHKNTGSADEVLR